MASSAIVTTFPELVLGQDESSQIRTQKKKLNNLARCIVTATATGRQAVTSKDLLNHFKVRFDRAQKSWERFQEIWEALDEHCIKSKEEEKFPTSDDMKFYYLVVGEIEEAGVWALETKKWEVPESNEMSLNATHLFRSPHLPKIRIPHFDGDLLKWCTFRDVFTSLVHEDTSISKVEKFNYLRDALEGEPATLISKMSVTDEAYSLAWEAVKKHYDNPRVLASHYIRTAMEYSPRHGRPSFETYREYLTGVVDNIEAFKSLKLEDSTEFLLSLLSLRALDTETRREFELAHLGTKFPSTSDVFDYVRSRITALRLCSDKDLNSSTSSRSKPNESQHMQFPRRSSPKYKSSTFHTSKESSYTQSRSPSSTRSSVRRMDSPVLNNKSQCPLCNKPHPLHQCHQFLNLPQQKRLEFVYKWKGCMNCLKGGHWSKSCPSKYYCKTCGKRHHSLLHDENRLPVKDSNSKEVSDAQLRSTSGASTSLHTQEMQAKENKYQILLGTAQVMVKSKYGKLLCVRALLDSCSHYTFVSSRLARKLGGRVQASKVCVSGLGGVALDKPSGSLQVTIIGRGAEFNVDALVAKSISAASPSSPVRLDVVAKMLTRDLADKSFGEPGPVDVLIGGDIFAEALTGAPESTPYPGMFLLPSVFGLVVMGKTPSREAQCFHTASEDLNNTTLEQLVERFWKVEEPESVSFVRPEDLYCETQFVEEHERTRSGRYIVKLPINPKAPKVGDNRITATRRFLTLERKLQSDRELGDHYRNFMEEYIRLGHMTVISSPSLYTIPHHGIWQNSLAKRKLRVVFDASCPARIPSDGSLVSLNDTLYCGPKLQPDIADVFTQFRMFSIALTADLVKMYRQVLVHPEQRAMQHILWRKEPSQPLLTYELNTLTYGMKPCAYLAIRTVRQLLIDEGDAFPLASSRIPQAMYVDDFVSGANTVQEAQLLREELIGLFAKGGFELGKWSSNVPSVVPIEEACTTPLSISEPEDLSMKILGMVWNPKEDTFSYCVVQPEAVTTKRKLLSTVARIFDPLGLLAPVIFSAKCLLQELWKAKLGWDDPLSEELSNRWKALSDEWNQLSNIHVPRHVAFPSGRRTLVGFCDASQRGSAAAVYCRSESATGQIRVHLIKAKTKLAPTHYVSIARLELCGALLLARMLASVKISGCDPADTKYFTDSMVVLSWLRTPSYELKTYEANRVNAILEKTLLSSWYHVRSEDNPADLASRGCGPNVLKKSRIWWNGPSWLAKHQDQWSVITLTTPATWMNEVRNALTFLTNKENVDSSIMDWISRFSSLRLLVRTVARILRFLRRSRSMCDPISASEYEDALSRCVRVTQRSTMPSMFSSGEVPEAYRSLSLFLDKDGVVRVGGRLKNAPVAYNQRHPMFLPNDAHLSRLIVSEVHQRNYHSGPTLTLALLRNKFWIPGGLRFVKGFIVRCVHCRKLKAKPLQPMMGSLPKERFSQFRAFSHTGVDFAGPFSIKASRRRKSPRNPDVSEKAYVCIFVCLASKAIHIECVSAMTTTAFLAALDRFCARRGAPQRIVSDNGSNFIGASRYLKDLFSFLLKQEESLIQFLSSQGIEWQFNPPRSPHFGGIWEAGVKSIKNLLTNTIGPQGFTFEELSTILIRIEGLLNSRPLCPLSEDVDQLDFLTPGHFLIGCPLNFIPDVCEQGSILGRWEIVKRQVAQVWERWKAEYLHHLQQKGKWLRDSPNPEVGDLVILMEKRGFPGQWPVARISEVHPGRDSKVRVVSVRCPSGTTLKRSVCSLAPLFFPESNDLDPKEHM